MKVLLIDGYIDEPAALGVPPYIAPLPRYVAGAALDAGAETVSYLTVDQLRAMGRGGKDGKARTGSGGEGPRRPRRPLGPPRGDWDILVAIGGAVVPGRYLRGRPASARELAELAAGFRGRTVLAGPVARYGWTSGRPAGERVRRAFSHVAEGDGDAFVHDLVDGDRSPGHRRRTMEEWHRWSVAGADVARQHSDHPRPLIAEVDTYRGCVRHVMGGCSFCTTVRDGPPSFRPPAQVGEEVAALANAGVVAFRLGGQSCIFSYMAEGVGDTETPRPSPTAVGALLDAVRTAAPGLEVLHVDNANPAVMAAHPEESAEVARLLVDRCTGGNVVALGLESADPEVAAANSLNSTPEECLEAVRLVNRVGSGTSPTGLPHLLPGLNFLAGLHGETPETFRLDLEFLRGVVQEGLLLRRINIRQVAPVCDRFDVARHHGEFRVFKERVREEIDRPMLEALLPYAAPLRRVFTEVHDGDTTFGRQVGSYPLIVGIPGRLELGGPVDVRVVGHGFRSVTAVPDPLPINDCPMAMLMAVPGIGRRRAARIVRARPIPDEGELRQVVDDPSVHDALAPLISY